MHSTRPWKECVSSGLQSLTFGVKFDQKPEWPCQMVFGAWHLEKTSTRSWTEWLCHVIFRVWRVEIHSTSLWKESAFQVDSLALERVNLPSGLDSISFGSPLIFGRCTAETGSVQWDATRDVWWVNHEVPVKTIGCYLFKLSRQKSAIWLHSLKWSILFHGPFAHILDLSWITCCWVLPVVTWFKSTQLQIYNEL